MNHHQHHRRHKDTDRTLPSVYSILFAFVTSYRWRGTRHARIARRGVNGSHCSRPSRIRFRSTMFGSAMAHSYYYMNSLQYKVISAVAIRCGCDSLGRG